MPIYDYNKLWDAILTQQLEQNKVKVSEIQEMHALMYSIGKDYILDVIKQMSEDHHA